MSKKCNYVSKNESIVDERLNWKKHIECMYVYMYVGGP